MKIIFKKSISFLLAVALLFTAGPFKVSFNASAAFIPEGFTPVYTADDLKGIGNETGGCYILMNDIDFSGSGLSPLALDFSGILDGNGFTLSNFSFRVWEGYIGLFGKNFGTIKNLNISNCVITSHAAYIGCIAALNYGSIVNCDINASVKFTADNFELGMYCGIITGDNAGTVSHCSSQGKLNIALNKRGRSNDEDDSEINIFDYIGAVAGINRGNLIYCRSSAKINAAANSPIDFDELTGAYEGLLIQTYAGGITGGNVGGTVSECYNSGNITVNAQTASQNYSAVVSIYSGGIAGVLSEDGIISNCYNSGNLSGGKNTFHQESFTIYLGGIAGLNDNSYIENTYNNAQVSYSATGGFNSNIAQIAGRNLQGSLTNCYWDFTEENKSLEETYGGFDFEYIWTIDTQTNGSYPQLIDNSEYIHIDEVSFDTLPTRLKYYQYESLNLLDTTLKITYSNGKDNFFRIVDVTKDMLMPVDMTTPGEKTVLVEYFGHTVSFKITVVEIALTSICVKTMPSKTTYYQGEEFDPSGLTVTAVYNNGSTVNVSDYTISSISMVTTGTKKIYVTYHGFSAMFSIVVLPLTMVGIEIETLPRKLTYKYGERLDTEGLVISVVYNSGRRDNITGGYTLSYDFSSPGTKSVEVSYLGKKVSFEVEVKWEYTATFVANGIVVGTVQFDVGATQLPEPVLPQIDGYTAAWEKYTIGTGDITINAVYTPIEFEAKFVAGGVTVDIVKYTVESLSIIEPAVPYRKGYIGSWESYELIAGGITVNAVYSEIKAQSVSISSPSNSVGQNKTIRLSATVKPEGSFNNKILWESSDDSIASVDKNGIVTGNGAGTVKITATVIDNKGNPVLDGDGNAISTGIDLTVKMSFLQKAVMWLEILIEALQSIFSI